MQKRMLKLATGEACLAKRLREKAVAASFPPIGELSIECVRVPSQTCTQGPADG